MRVAFISYDFGEYSVRLASALSRHADVLLALPSPLAAPHLSRLDPRVRLRAFDKPRLRQPVRQLRSIATLVREIRRFRPDVLHMQHGHLWFNGALSALDAPLVVTVHDAMHHSGDRDSRRTPQWVMNLGYHRASSLIVHGEGLRRAVSEQLAVSSDRIHVIPHIALGDERCGCDVAEEQGSVLFFGRIWPYKGLEYLIRAEPHISAAVPAARIVIAGSGEDFARYRRLMTHPERFLVRNEFIPDEECATLFRRASVVALPYIEASQSGVIPLAYTYRKAVVATAVGALPELVDDGRTGYIVRPRDERALADAIVRLLRNPELRRTFGENGARKMRTDCAPDVVAQMTLAVYRQALEGGHTIEHRLRTRLARD